MAKKILTKKQQTIIALVLAFRFINSKQIQKFLGHKDHRRINAWLKDLWGMGYLERDFKPVFGTITKPAVYFLAIKGRDYIRKNFEHVSRKYLARLADDKKRSKAFRIRCQLVADCQLTLFPEKTMELTENFETFFKKGVKLRYDQLEFFTPAFFAELDFILLPVLKPDAYLYLRRRQGISHIFFYVLDAYIPQLILMFRLKQIFAALEEEPWEDDDSTLSLQIYFVCPNNMIIVYLRRLLGPFIESYYGKTLMFYFATRNQLYARQKNKTGKTGWICVSSEGDYG